LLNIVIVKRDICFRLSVVSWHLHFTR